MPETTELNIMNTKNQVDLFSCLNVKTSMIFLKLEDIKSIVHTKVDELRDFLCEDFDTTLILFHHFKWSKDRLENSDWFADQDALKVKSGLKPIVVPTKEESEKNICLVCFCEEDPKELDCLDCGHKICKSCWIGFVNDKVIDIIKITLGFIKD